MKIRLTILVCMFSVTIFSQSIEEKRIINIVEEMWTAMEQNNVDLYMSYFHSNYTTFGEYKNELQVGKQTEKESITVSLSNITKYTSTMSSPKVNINDETAWISYYW